MMGSMLLNMTETSVKSIAIIMYMKKKKKEKENEAKGLVNWPHKVCKFLVFLANLAVSCCTLKQAY